MSPLAAREVLAVSVPGTFLTLGIVYLILVVITAQFYQNPPQGWRPVGWEPRSAVSKAASTFDFTVKEEMSTLQFWLLWVMLFLNVSAGIMVISQASPMAQQLVGLTPVAAAGIVGVISIFNGLGRVFWAAVSDYLGTSSGRVEMKKRATAIPLGVMTIGHSTRPIDEFIHLLRLHGVQRLVDVRTVPRSRHNPQFNRDQLSPSLHSARIHYSYMPGLGGFRHAQHDSVNSAWRNASFRGYADYMQTPEFHDQMDALIELAQQERIAVMCAEAVPWRCHRSLIADALLVRGIEVREITSATTTRLHSLTPFAHVNGTQVIYPAEQSA